MSAGIGRQDSEIARSIPRAVSEYNFSGMTTEASAQGERIVGV